MAAFCDNAGRKPDSEIKRGITEPEERAIYAMRTDRFEFTMRPQITYVMCDKIGSTNIMLLNVAFYITWIALLAGPVVGALLIWNLRAVRRDLISRLSIISASLVAIVSSSFWLGIQTFSPAVNFGFCLAAFLAYCFLASAAWTLKPRALAVASGIVTYATLIPCYLVGTVGALGLIFVMGDYLSPPIHVEKTKPGLFCRITGWGAVFSDEGYDVHIYRYATWFPVLRYEAAKVRVDETNPGDGPAKATCADVAASLI